MPFFYPLKKLTCCFFFLTLLCFTHCTNKESSTNTQNQSSPLPILRLGYFANLTHAQAILGVETKAFEKAIQPVKLQTKIFNAGPSLMEALFAGEIDIAYVGPGPALNAYQKSKGQEVRVVAGAAANGVLIVASPESKITKLNDLKGKKIATPQLGNTQDISARHYLQSNFGKEALTQIVPIPNAEQSSLMARGEIAASWAPEPWGTVLLTQNNAKLISEEKDLWPDKKFILTVIAVSTQFLKQHPSLLEKFLKTHSELTAQLVTNPAQYTDTLVTGIEKLTGKKLDKDIIVKAVKNIQFTTDPMPSTFETYAKWKEELEMGKSDIPLKDLFETKFDTKRNITSDEPGK